MMQQQPHIQLDIRQKVRQFIERKSPAVRQKTLTDHDSLLDNNIIDSMGFLELVGYVETEFGITVEEDELMTENFESILSITNFIHSKIKSM